ncbi:unnamed protein product [Rangifer tarandus platyrhynchus]|uniref:Uncharacterized protein n=1 Tax=Rangifer tarandus platyrhynchus TaxID=3082113 RepID=A0ABN9A7K0_RANTA|nr:unnamed protein product [Rangifer tarandus platyrhynchus]
MEIQKSTLAWTGLGVSQQDQIREENWVPRAPLLRILVSQPVEPSFSPAPTPRPEATALVIDASTGSPQSQILLYITMGLPICLLIFVFSENHFPLPGIRSNV